MRSLSDVLIKKREEKKLTIEQVSYETNISRKYIQALEEEDFSAFPAEAYLLGFLRNYAEFLDIEYETIYSEYKNCLLREEPTPLDELVGNKRKIVFKPWMVIIPLVAAVLFFGIPPLVDVVKNQIEKRKEALRAAGENQNKIINITDDYSGQKVKVGDSFKLETGDKSLTYIVQDVSSDISLKEIFKGEEKIFTLKLGKEVDFTYEISDREYVITLLLKDIGGFSDNSAIVKARVQEKEKINVIKEMDFSNQTNDNEVKVLITKQGQPEPYSISINFEGNILFRYQEKGKGVVENYYRKGMVLNLDITRSVRLFTSNAGLTKLKINGEPLILGKSGSVHVFDLRWIYYKDKGEYRLEYTKAY